MPNEAWKKAEAARKAARLAAGLCVKCGKEPAKPSCQVGALCAAKHATWTRNNITKARKNKTCPQCHKPAAYQRVYCKECADKIKGIYDRRRAAGLCTFCDNKPAPAKRLCGICSDRVAANSRRMNIRRRDEILEAYGGKCACCGESTPEFLAVDHINNDGATHRRELKMSTGSRFYVWLRKEGYPRDKFQLLCVNCNWAKYRYGQCPHERERQKTAGLA